MFDKEYLENLRTELNAEAMLMVGLTEKLENEASKTN